MTKKQVMRLIIEMLSHELKNFGFEPNFMRQEFIKETSNNIFFCQLLIYDRTNIKTGAKGFLIEPFIFINVREIEKYFSKITLNSELKKITDFVTIGESIAEIIANPDGIHRKWNESLDLFVFEEKNIKYVASQISKYFKEVARPYFAKNATIAAVDKILNVYPNEYSVHSSNDNLRIIKGVIAAKLNKNPSLKQLIYVYEKQLLEWDMHESTKEEMRRLKIILPMI